MTSGLATSWVFNWRADSWYGKFESETHTFVDGVTGHCVLQHSCAENRKIWGQSHFIGYQIQGLDKGRVHVTLSILDKNDQLLRTLLEEGTSAAPQETDFSKYWGKDFTPTAEDMAQAARADGSIRLRVVLRLFLDGLA